METTVNPIYLVGGGKGGVGKSLVALALVDHLQRRGVKPVLVENDTSNPDVMKAVQGEIDCAAFDLDEADGWINFVDYCDEHRGRWWWSARQLVTRMASRATVRPCPARWVSLAGGLSCSG